MRQIIEGAHVHSQQIKRVRISYKVLYFLIFILPDIIIIKFIIHICNTAIYSYLPEDFFLYFLVYFYNFDFMFEIFTFKVK